MAFDIGLSWLLIGIVVFFPGTFIVTYVISVMLGHVHPAFPYISDTGTLPPESCVFAQMLNIGSVIVAVTMYVRYRQLGDHLDALQRRHIVVNKLSFIVGLMSAFGASVVANFQVSNVLIVHLIGAFLTFCVGMVYAWLQVVLSFNTCPQLSSRFMCIVRLTVSIFASITLLLTFIFAGVARKIANRGFYDEMWWWQLYTVSTVFEWVLAIFNVVYFLTFFGEFRRICINLPLLRTIKNSPPAVELNGILLAYTVSEWMVSLAILIFFLTFFNEFRTVRMALPVIVPRSRQRDACPAKSVTVTNSDTTDSLIPDGV